MIKHYLIQGRLKLDMLLLGKLLRSEWKLSASPLELLTHAVSVNVFISILWNYNFCLLKKPCEAITQEGRNPVLIPIPYLVYFISVALLCTYVCLSVYVCVYAE